MSKKLDEVLLSAKFMKQRGYWLTKLPPGIEKTELLFKLTPGIETGKEIGKQEIRVPDQLFAGLMKLGKQSDLSLYIILLTALKVLIYRYTGREEVIVGSPVFKPNISRETLNFRVFIRDLIDEGSTFIEQLLQIRKSLLEAYENQDYPSDKITEYLLNVPADKNGITNPLTDITCLLSNIHNSRIFEDKDIQDQLIFSFERKEKGLNGLILFNGEVYNKAYIQLISKYFMKILENSIADIKTKIPDISLFSGEEEQRLMVDFNQTPSPYPKEKTLVQLIEEQVERTPGHIAVVDREAPGKNCHISYMELSRKSGHLAHRLREKGVRPGAIVGIKMGRSIDIIVGLLGILRAGGAFLPIALDYPAERIDYMLTDSNAGWLVTSPDNINAHADGNCGSWQGETVVLEDGKAGNLQDNKSLSGTANNRASDLAYVIYTSGTSGKAKGVMIEHQSIVNYACWAARMYVKNEPVNFPLFTSISFDLTITSIFVPLLSGNTIAVYGEENQAVHVERIIDENRVDVVKLTPSHLALIKYKNGDLFSSRVKRFILGGEELETRLTRDIYNKFNGNIEIYNEYGPTEAAVGCMIYQFDPRAANRRSVPIGDPISNTRIYILDKELRPVPIGAAGRLWISGDGVARGYLNRIELTAEKFIRAPFASLTSMNRSQHDAADERLYHTGDLARRLLDGNIEFLGRIDQQVKIRGYRIEPGEIESRLVKYDKITEAVVIAGEVDGGSGGGIGDKHLCAYFVSENRVDIHKLRDSLSGDLPDYMIPSYFMPIDKIPLTLNGKVDIKALPRPVFNAGPDHTPPRNPLEKKLAEIWADVLGAEKDQIGIDAKFFETGGNSLRATVLMTRIHKELHVKVLLEEIFKNTTIRELALHMKGLKEERFASIEVEEEKEYYQLSSAQKRLYVLQQLHLESTGYNVPLFVRLDGPLDIDKLKNTFLKMIDRHESLRTSIEMLNREAVQRIHKEVEFDVEYHRSGDNPQNSEKIIKEFIRPFDLSHPPLLRVGLIQTAAGRDSREGHILMVDMHHIVTDAASMDLFTRDFKALYAGEVLPRLRIAYKDYSTWQNKEKQREEITQQKEFWLEEFEGEIPVLHLPTDYARPVEQGFEGKRISFQLEKEKNDALKKMALETDSTMFIVLLAICNVFLSKISGQEDIVVGSPIANRRHADLEKIIGMFINTLALRNYPLGEKTFTEFLAEVRKKTLATFENQEYPFEDLVDQVVVNRDTGRNPLFDVMLLVHGTDIPGEETAIQGLELSHFNYETGMTKFDLTVNYRDMEDKAFVTFGYSVKLFNQETIERFTHYFKKLVSQIIEGPDKKIAEMEIISDKEKKRLLEDFNNTATQYSKDKTLHQLFEEQAEKNPDNTAVIGMKSDEIPSPIDPPGRENQHLTYRELNAASHQLAVLLQTKGMGAGSIVGIMAERSIETMIGLIGTLKVGAAYLPIDPAYPPVRKNYMLSDSNAGLLLTTENLSDEITFEKEIMYLSPGLLTHGPSPSPQPKALPSHPSDMAYVIYTSGTSGKPKGVMIDHQSIVNYICWAIRMYVKNGPAYFPLYTSISFDLTLTSIFVPLSSGNTVAVYGEENRGPHVERIIDESRINIVKLTPSHLALIKHKEENFSFSRMRRFILGGEELEGRLARDIYKKFHGNIEIYNEYGPTEAAVGCMIYQFDPHALYQRSVPIGNPISNTQIYILDKKLRPVPIGLAGELWIGGQGVARGYLNRVELTAGKFIRAPFGLPTAVPGSPRDSANERLYHTGDRARRLPDGNIEFLGRSDEQVKIRGYRVEPGEIENQLLKYDNIKKAVVVAVEEDEGDDSGDAYGDIQLCAYFVSDNEIDLHELREKLSGDLPHYMVPSYFMPVEKIPLTMNGKVDVKALPRPLFEAGGEYTAPGNKVEEILAEIWSDVLGIQKDIIGINDNFFELGGHSLKATTLIARIHKEFNVKIPLVRIFKNSTIRQQAGLVHCAEKEKFLAIEKAEEKEYYDLASPQKRLFILQQMNIESTGYNMTGVYELKEEPDKQRLKDVFKQLIRRHESLRTSFEMIKGKPVQRIHDDVELEIEYHDMGSSVNSHLLPVKGEEGAVTEIIDRFIRPFDLSHAPLLRVGLIKTAAGNLLLVDMHHIISDGISNSVLFTDFTAIYGGDRLPPLNLQYRDYSEWQNLETETVKQQEMFWLKQFEGELPVLDLPYDYVRPAVRSFEGRSIAFFIGKKDTTGLKNLAPGKEVTLFMSLLAALNILLSKLSGLEDIIVGTPVASRRHVDMARGIGMFVNTLALRNFPSGDRTFKEFLQEVKIRTLSAFENQEYPFEDLVDKIELNRDMSRNPLFDVILVLQNQREFPGEIPPAEQENETPDVSNTPGYKYESRTSRFDISLTGVERGGQLHFNLGYGTTLFKEETIGKFINYFKQIVSSVVWNPGLVIEEIEIMSEEEKNRVLVAFNDTAMDYPARKTLHRLFEEQVEKTPKAMAVNGPAQGGKCMALTYEELNEKANRFSYLLQEKGVSAGAIVGIMMERSLEMILGILGILKAGGAYLPIDPGYPQNRIRFMLSDSNTAILVSEVKEAGGWQGTIIAPSLEESGGPGMSPGADRVLRPAATCAYIIYTSGTTGQPKGVAVEHRTVVNMLLCRKESYGMNVGDVSLQLFSFSFDGFVTSLFTPLISGAASAILSEEEVRDTGKIVDVIVKTRVTHFISVPALYRSLLDILTPTSAATLKAVTLAGDKVPPDILESTRDKNDEIELYNEYGVTECSVMSTIHRYREKGHETCIGKPIWNTKIYILNKRNRPLPVGVPGEMCISGTGVAMGYLNRPELTNERFVDSLDDPAANDRLYRTGDLARWLPDGTIQFLGRLDNQVKIRGFRIELGEIESQLLKHDGIKETVVMGSGAGEAYLTAYIVLEASRTLSVPQLRTYLSTRLPGYMVPSYFVQIEHIPVTSIGKVDRKALESLGTALETGVEYVAPVSDMEKVIADVWKEVLQRDKVGINDNFFDLGGNSLNILRVNSVLNERLDSAIPVVKLFQHTTIGSLATHLSEVPTRESAAEKAKEAEALNRVKDSIDETLSIFNN